MIQSLTMSDYLSHSAYGSSDIIAMGRSFAYWKWKKENPPKPTRGLIVGSVTHLMLQAEYENKKTLLEDGVRIYQDGTWRTKGFEKFSAENKSFYCVDSDEYAMIQRMVAALVSEPEVVSYLDGAVAEPSVVAKYPHSDVLCKCRPDYLHQKRGVSINIKTTTDASESGFIYSAKDWQYDWQSAFYVDMLTQEFGKPFDEVHIIVEKPEANEPVNVAIRSFGDETIQWARSMVRQIIEKIPDYENSGVWPKADVRLQTLELPLYARKAISL